MKKLFLFRFWKSWKRKHPHWSLGRAIFGFTLIEMLVVMAIVGVLAAIVGPTWLGSLNRQRLSESQNQIYRAIKETQSYAKRDKVIWQTSFRTSPVDGVTAQVAVTKASNPIGTQDWKPVVSNVVINTALTTAPTIAGIYVLQFDGKGQPIIPNTCVIPPGSDLIPCGKVTLAYGSQTGAKACVNVRTLIGGITNEFDTGCN
ncbi:hypothetical protein TUMEXPCC7403_06550 [Tumidithrix helvetica PCC 7403]|uniref:pilus assembly FimT family protein n=1 Tax=Tumidithrix helvetica TaxID=3457545 RepID=UPI003C8C88C6